MYRPYLTIWLVFAGTAPGTECSIATSPDGFCAAIRLEPSHAELPTGGTVQIKIIGLECTHGHDCGCARYQSRVHWSSSAPAVAAVDSTGLVRAERLGIADIHLDSEESIPQRLATMRVIVGQ